MFEKFYAVYVPGSHSSIRHKTLDLAKAEAARLVAKGRGTATVMESIAQCAPVDNVTWDTPISWSETEED